MIYVTSDIHGRLDRFEALLQLIDLREEDRLYIAGDLLGEDPRGLELLLRVMDMPNAVTLLGDHELMARDALVRGRDCRLWLLNGGFDTLSAFGAQPELVQEAIRTYLNAMPASAELTIDDRPYLILHAAPEPLFVPPCFHENTNYSSFTFPEYAWYGHARDRHDEVLNEDEMHLWARLQPDDGAIDGKTVIFGHDSVRHYNHSCPPRVWFDDDRVAIDCDCDKPDGRLACLRLDDMEVFYS